MKTRAWIKNLKRSSLQFVYKSKSGEKKIKTYILYKILNTWTILWVDRGVGEHAFGVYNVYILGCVLKIWPFFYIVTKPR